MGKKTFFSAPQSQKPTLIIVDDPEAEMTCHLCLGELNPFSRATNVAKEGNPPIYIHNTCLNEQRIRQGNPPKMRKTRLRGGPLNGFLIDIDVDNAPPFLYFAKEEDVEVTDKMSIEDISTLTKIEYHGFLLTGRYGDPFIRYYHPSHPDYDPIPGVFLKKIQERIRRSYEDKHKREAAAMIASMLEVG